MGVLEAGRIGAHLAVGAVRAEERLRQARNTSERLTVYETARLAGGRGTVAVRQPQTVMVPPREPIDGNALLLDVRTGLEHFAVWPKEAALVASTLYAGQAHGRDGKTQIPVWPYSPHLFFTAAEADGGSGKSWMARLVGQFCPDGKMLVEPNKANFVRMIERRVTPIVTELDVLVNTGGRNKWFTGLANATYEADQETQRTQNGKQIDIPMQTPLILDGLESVIKGTGKDLKTLVSRCIIIHVERAPEGYRPPRFGKTARAVFARGSVKLGEWMGQVVNQGIKQVNDDGTEVYIPIEDYVPDVPEWLGNRAAALWEPLFAVADAAGGEWPKWARMACADLEHGGDSWATNDGETDDEREAAYRAALDAWRNGGTVTAPDEADELPYEDA